jgi:hypothetical protein
MTRKLTLSATLGVLLLAASCAAEQPKADEAPAPAADKAPAPEKVAGPYYELTKDDVTSHADWTSMNVMLKGVKIGDKGPVIEKTLGTADKLDLVGTDHYRAVYGKSSFSIYTYKFTTELQKIEIFGRMADQIADPIFKNLLTTHDLKYMREAFGMEDEMKQNLDTTANEWIYDAKGFRFAEYNLTGQKVYSIVFSKK